jgi:hypothetical protein
VTTAKAEENLLTYSQEFDDASWTKGSVTVTANSATTAPDGTTTADLFYPSSTGTWRIIYKSGIKANIQYTLTVYAKASGFSNFFVGFDNQTTTVAWFNLTTGVKGTKGANITSSDMTSVGNGWYRCQVVFTHTSDSFALFGVADADNSSTATASGTNGALIWGAQAEQRSSATAYTATTTQAITNYIPVLQTAASGVARFDHNPTTGESLGLLIEEARTNSQTYSQDFTNAVWNNEASRTIITANTAIAPDGTLTADKFAATTDNNVHRVYNSSLSISAGVATTISWFAKRDGYDVAISDSGNRYSAWFNLSTGTATVTLSTDPIIASMVPVGNGWYRCVATITPANSGNFPIINSYNGGTSFAGNGFSGFFIWGYQFEVGAFATSYIPTVASTVTRNADAASMTGTNFSSWFNNGEGSYVINGSVIAQRSGGKNGALQIDDGSTSNMITTLFDTDNHFLVYVNGSATCAIDAGTVAAGTTTLFAGGYQVNSFGAVINGGTAVSDTSGNVPNGLNRMLIGLHSTEYLNGRLAKVAYYPKRLTNAQLQALTV